MQLTSFLTPESTLYTHTPLATSDFQALDILTFISAALSMNDLEFSPEKFNEMMILKKKKLLWMNIISSFNYYTAIVIDILGYN